MAGRTATRRRNRNSSDGHEDGAPTAARCSLIALLIVAATVWIMRSDIPPPEHTPDPRAEEKSAVMSMLDNVAGQTDPPFVESSINEKSAVMSMLDNVTGQTDLPFVESSIKYGMRVNATKHTLPDPKRTNQTTVVLVLSARGHFERRAAIRETWAKTNDNVYFVIGGPGLENSEDTNMSNPLSVSSLLFREQELYGDIIDSIHTDSYKSLPYKLHFGMTWVLRNLKQVNWIVKVDDDTIVRVKLLQFFVLRKFNPHHPIVIGNIVVGAPPHRKGKWAEDPKFKGEVYPPWAFGSAGYVVSRSVADYIANQDDLYYYQGEDAGLGIWLEESPLQVTFIDTPEFNNQKLCQPHIYIIGHALSIPDLKLCFDTLGDNVPERKSIIAFAAGRKDQHPSKIAQ